MADTNRQKVVIYHENWLLRKEGVKQWSEYWGVIRGRWLQFYEKSSEYSRPELRKTLELTPETKCSLVKRNKNRFPFSIDNGNGIYYIKVETEIERYHWIVSILSSALSKPKRELPSEVPPSMVEAETFRKLTKDEKLELKKQRPSPPKREPIRAADMTNKRRRKYAERRENKVKKKEAARRKKKGMDPNEHDSESDEEDNGVITEKHPEVLRRARNINQLSNNNDDDDDARIQQKYNQRQQRLEAREKRLGSSPAPLKNNSSNEIFEIKAMVHPPTTSSKKVEFASQHNMAYEDEEIEDLPSVPVILEDNGLLPNMVLTGVSDSEDESTEEISLNSQTGLMMLNSSMDSQQDILFDITGNEYKNKTITTRTVLSDDGHIQHPVSPQDARKNRPRSANRERPTSANRQRPTSANRQRPTSANNQTLLERPISPLLANPLSPQKHSKKNRPTSPSNFVDVSSPKPVRNAAHFSRFLNSSSSTA